jgi:hypothetical protein
MSYFSYIDENQSNDTNNFKQLIQNEEKKAETDTYDQQLEQLNNSMLDWRFNNSRRSLGGIYGNLSENKLYQSSRNEKYNTSSLHNTSNNRINAHIFNNELEIESNIYHQNNDKRQNFIDMENQLRNLPINNHSSMKKNIKKKTILQNHVKPRQNKYSNYPNKQSTYNHSLNAENQLRYSKIKKKTEGVENTSFVQSKRNQLFGAQQTNTVPGEQNNNPYINRLFPTNSNNPNNRII